MNSWPSFAAPLRTLLGQLSPQQRLGLWCVLGVGLLAGGWCTFSEPEVHDQPLFGGKTYQGAELRAAQSTLKEAGITGIRIAGGRILVPAERRAQCESLLSGESTGKSAYGEHYEKALSQSAWPVSESHRQELMDSARAAELMSMFKADPNIADARLMWNRGKRRTFSSDGRTTAVLGITPRPGRSVSPELAESLKTAVSSAFGLTSSDEVTLIEHSPQGAKLVRPASTDEVELAALTTPAPAPPPDPLAESIATLEERLAWIPHVKVDVQRRLPTDDSHVAYRPRATLSGTSADRPLLARSEPAAAETVLVTVEIPPAVTRSLTRPNVRPEAPSEGRAKPKPTRADVRRKVEQIVARTLQADPAIPPREFVKVVFQEASETNSESSTRDLPQQILATLQTWPGACGAFGALLLLVWGLPRALSRADSPSATTSLPAETEVSAATSLAPPEEPVSPQGAVEDDPGLDLSALHRTGITAEDVAAARQTEGETSVPGRDFAMLHDCSADEWRQLLADEQPQAIAVILSRLPPAQSAFVLRLMPAAVRLDVVRRIAALDPPSPAVLADFAADLESRLRQLRQSRLPVAVDSEPVRRGQPASGLMLPTTAPAGRDPLPMTTLQAVLPKARFHDLVMLDDGALRELFASFDVEHWSIALRGADDSILSKLRGSLTAEDAGTLDHSMEHLGPVRLSDVDAAQRAIAQALAPLRFRGRRYQRLPQPPETVR